MKTISEIKTALENRKDRSAWNKGVTIYALENEILNGATSWYEYSWGGLSLIYDFEIAERLCSPSELKKTRNGERNPNKSERWLDVQARALYQAFNRIKREVRK